MAMPAFDPFDEDDDPDEYDDPLAPTSLDEESACAFCGCTETTPCIGEDGLPCHQVTPTLCSACMEP
jgi:hypothetical protein